MRPRVTVVGAGNVGATTAHLIALKGLADVVLLDIVEGLAEGKALDMAQSASVEGFPIQVRGSSDFNAMAQSRVVVITAGLARKPGMSRDDLLAANANIVGPIAEKVAACAPGAIIVVVTNPLDVMTALALQRSRFPKKRVMGMAGILDTARLKAFVAMKLGVAASEVEATVLGSHGDLMVPVRESIKVRGKDISGLLPSADVDALLQRTKDGGAEIVKLLKQGSAFYAPASSAVQMVNAILKDTHETLPVCTLLEGEYGIKDVCIGVPAQIGSAGVERVVELPLAAQDKQALAAAAGQVAGMMKSLQSLIPAA